MPIVGITDQESASMIRATPRLVTLYKGAPKPQENRPGKDLDYFRLEVAPQFGHLAPFIEGLYGPKPVVIPRIMFDADTVEEAFTAWKEEWGYGKLNHRCDGETQVRHWDTSRDSYSDEPIKCAAPKCKCKQVGRLSFLLPDLTARTGVIGHALLVTHSFYDIVAIHRYLTWARSTLGTLRGVPFELGRANREITIVDQDGKRMNVEKSLIYMNVDPRFTRDVLLPSMTTYNMAELEMGRAPRQLSSGIEMPEGEDFTRRNQRALEAPQTISYYTVPDEDVIDTEAFEEEVPTTRKSRPNGQQRQQAAPQEAPQEKPQEDNGAGVSADDFRKGAGAKLLAAVKGRTEMENINEIIDILLDIGATPTMTLDQVMALWNGEAEAAEDGDDLPDGWPDEYFLMDITPTNFHTRPLVDSPVVLSDALNLLVPPGMLKKATVPQKAKAMGLLVNALEGAVEDVDSAIDILCQNVFGVGRTDITQGHNLALLTWLQDADKNLHPNATQEALLLVEWPVNEPNEE